VEQDFSLFYLDQRRQAAFAVTFCINRPLRRSLFRVCGAHLRDMWQGNSALRRVEAVVNHLQRCVKFGWYWDSNSSKLRCKLERAKMFGCTVNCVIQTDAAFTLDGFDDQERNLTFVKTGFQVLKLKFYSCNFKQAFQEF